MAINLEFDFDYQPKTPLEKYLDYHQKNPQVYEELVRLAREWSYAGHAKLGIKTLIERLRWEYHLTGKHTDGFKINNNFAPYYAREIMYRNEDLRGLFDIRTLQNGRW